MLQNLAMRLALVLLPPLVLSGLQAKNEAVTTAATAAPTLMSSGGTALRSTMGTTAQDPSAVEASLELDRPTRRLIQQGLRNEGFDLGMPDGLFGPRTRDAIRDWQQLRGGPSTGYLNASEAELLRAAAAPPAAMSDATSPDDGALEARPRAEAEPTLPVPPPGVSAEQPIASAGQPAADPPASEAENLFWQSIMNSTDPAEFEAYLAQFPNGMFRTLAQVRLAAADVRRRADAEAERRRQEAEAERRRLAELRRPGRVFRDCDSCPEMVVLPGGRLAMGRYEVTVGEYRAFATAAVAPTGDCYGDSWRDPGFPQTDRHPVVCVSWDDAQAYLLWLGRTTGAPYRLPSEAEWERAAARSQPGCKRDRTGNWGTCPVGSYDSNAAGLSDMFGNVSEWTSDCWEGNCGRRVLRGDSWFGTVENFRPGVRSRESTRYRTSSYGFRVSRTLD